MRTSKLDKHAEWLRHRLNDGAPIQRLHRELSNKKGCRVGLETLRRWAAREADSKRISRPKPRRGRPPNAAASALSFLPSESADSTEVSVPPFLLALLNPDPAYDLRRLSLQVMEIYPGEPEDFIPWARGLGTGTRRLSDLDYCLLTFLADDSFAIPFNADRDAIEMWAKRLLVAAANLKSLVQRAARNE